MTAQQINSIDIDKTHKDMISIVFALCSLFFALYSLLFALCSKKITR